MAGIVVKFGGSNLKSSADLKKILQIVQSYQGKPVIVVSAFYGITDLLVESIKEATENPEGIDRVIEKIREKFSGVISMSFADTEIESEARDDVENLLNELKRHLLGVHYIGEIPDFLEDRILIYGEKITASLLNALINASGFRSELVAPEDIPLVTDGEYGNASVIYDACKEAVKKALSGNQIYVIPGFYGVSESGKPTIFGRGGSDYSAAVIARCTDAGFLDVWKDVDGFLSGDPKLIKNPVKLDKITYAEAAELAYFGAKILHPRTVEPLIDPHIPIRIFSILSAGKNPLPLSIINSEEFVRDGVVKSVTYSDEFCVIKLRGPGVGIKPGILAKVTSQLSASRINISSVITSQISINLVINKQDKDKAFRGIGGLKLNTVREILVLDDVSLIAVVGQGMLENHGVASRIFSSVAKNGINVHISCSGASQVVSYLIVDRADRNKAVRGIHQEFFNNNKKIT